MLAQGSVIKIFKHPVYNNSAFSASYVKYSNWKHQYSNMAFNVKEQLSYDTTRVSGLGLHSRIYCELGFTKFIDSVWYTNADIWEIQHSWNIKESKKKWTTSYGIYLTSQFLSRYEWMTDYSGDEPVRQKQWQSGFFNPFLFEFSYGKTYTFWQICRINFSLAQIRVSSEPIVAGNTFSDEDGLFIINNNTIINSEYGLGVQVFIRKKFNGHFRWENSSRFFGNAVNPRRFSFDFKNSFIVNPMKHLMICFNTRLLYRPVVKPYKVQQRYELMLGVEF